MKIIKEVNKDEARDFLYHIDISDDNLYDAVIYWGDEDDLIFETQDNNEMGRWKGTGDFNVNYNINADGEITAGGNITAEGEIAAYSSSDQLLKKNIQDFSATDIINGLNPKVFQWNDTAKNLNKNKDDRLNYGLIAQEVEEVMPEMVRNMYGGKYLGLDYEQLIPVLLQGMKEQQEKIEKLEKQQTPKNQ